MSKIALDYFPLDVEILSDDKIFELEENFKSQGLATLIKLWCFIYRDKGYYCIFDEKIEKRFCRMYLTIDDIDYDSLSNILNLCFKLKYLIKICMMCIMF